MLAELDSPTMRFFRLRGVVRALLCSAVLSVAPRSVSAQPQEYYTGDGGKSIRIAVLEPVGKRISADDRWMLSLVQGTITGDFNKYSAMTVIDRQNLENVFAEWKESMSGHYSDADRVKIGNLTTANHILTGSISKTANAFMLELSVTDLASGVRKASYSPTPISQMALENLSAIKAASAELLRQLGVELTAAAQSELKRAANITQIQAQTALSRGIAAQRRGTEVAALSYFYQAAALDPSLFEAASRSSVMAADISSGNIGSDVRNEIAWRKNWVARLKETEETFYNIVKSVDPPYTLFYSTGIEKKKIHFDDGNETADFGIPINLVANMSWFNAMNRSLQAVQTVLNGLDKTNKKGEWGLGGWPRNGVTNTNPFDKLRQYDIEMVFELVNQQGRVIGSQTVRLSPAFKITRSDDRVFVAFDDNAFGVVEFNGVSAYAITDNLTIRVASVNGGSPKAARFTITAISAETRKEYLNWRVKNGIVLGFSDDQRKQPRVLVDIPNEVWGQPVTAVGGGAFSDSELRSVTIPGGVKTIGERAFENNRLAQVIIPDGVASIGNGAFANNNLSDVTIPNSVRTIEAEAFYDNEIKQITIGERVQLGSSALPSDFISSYNRGGGRADTYYLYDGLWVNGKEAERMRVAAEAEAERRMAEEDAEKERARVVAERRRVEEEAERERIRVEAERRRAEAEAEAERMREAMARRRVEAEEIKEKAERMERRRIKFGWRATGGFTSYAGVQSSEWFNINYPDYDYIGQSDTIGGGNLSTGLMLYIRLSESLILAGELNYAYLWNEYTYRETPESDHYAVAMMTYNSMIHVPVLLHIRVGVAYFECGYQMGFPISSKIEVGSGSEFQYPKFRDSKDFSEFRVDKDQGIVIGLGIGGGENLPRGMVGLRYVYSLTKWDKDGHFKTPHTLSFTLGLYIF